MKTKMTKKHKLMAYILNREFGYTMKGIATLVKVSQSSISTSIKEVEYWKIIQNLSNELQEAQSLLAEQGILPPSSPVLYIE